MTVDISVVLSTWNNQKMLQDTLMHLLSCSQPQGASLEFIVVDNNSRDGTRDVIHRVMEADDGQRVRYLFEGEQGLSHARQAGLQHAKGELVIFTDDDVRPSTNWIVEYWNAFSRYGDDSFFGGPIESTFERPLPPELIPYAPYSVKGLTFGSDARHLEPGRYTFLGANWAAARTSLLTAGGFDKRLGLNSRSGPGVGEETRLMERLVEHGRRPYYVAGAILQHFVPADKVALEHIACRYQAYHYYRAARQGLPRSRTFESCGVPAWLIAELASNGCAYWMRRLTGRPWLASYMRFRRSLGTAQAARLLARSRPNSAGARSATLTHQQKADRG